MKNIMCFSKKCPEISILKIMKEIPDGFVIRYFSEDDYEFAPTWAVSSHVIQSPTYSHKCFVYPYGKDKDRVVLVNSWRDIKKFIKDNCVAGQEENEKKIMRGIYMSNPWEVEDIINNRLIVGEGE